MNFSRMSQRKSQDFDESAAVASTRICMVFSVASVTCRFQNRLSHSGFGSMISLSALRSLVQRHRVVHPHKHRAEQTGGGARPVLKRLFDEITQRHDKPAVVPDVDDYIRQSDFLDAAPFALDDDHVVQADRLGHGELEAGEQIGNGFLRGEIRG